VIVRSVGVPATALAVCGLMLIGCGGGAAIRAQGGRFSRVPDVHSSDVEGKRPVAVLEGQATYYSDSFAGRATTSGEPYDPARRTAASRDLPFGSVLRVTRRDTGAQVIVRVNDRGPFGDHRRILDLSRAAARDLQMLQSGVVPVRAEVLVLGVDKPKPRKQRKH
jgi:rare lipoprotein A (peptidoglycan hydrolase)